MIKVCKSRTCTTRYVSLSKSTLTGFDHPDSSLFAKINTRLMSDSIDMMDEKSMKLTSNFENKKQSNRFILADMLKTRVNKTALFLCLFFFIENSLQPIAAQREWQHTNISTEYAGHIDALANVYGYIRYFYPNDVKGNFDWLKYLNYAVKEIESCESTLDFHVKLQELFSPFCPHLRISDSGTIAVNTKLTSNESFYLNEHTFNNRKGQFVSKMKKINCYSSVYPKPDSMYHFNINSNLSISFPIAVSEIPDTRNKITKIQSDKRIFYKEPSYYFFSDYHARIANEIIRCNIVQHFYPYYFEDSLDLVWKQKYNDYFRKIADCENMYDFYWAICRMMNHVKDSHANIHFILNAAYARTGYPELETIIKNGQLFVKSIGTPYNQHVKYGDHIIKINGKDATDFMNEKLSHLSYSTLPSGWTRLTNGSELFKTFPDGNNYTNFELTIKQSEGNEKVVEIPANKSNPFYQDNNRTFIKELEEKIYYVNLTNPGITKYKSFRDRIDELNDGKGIIFDMRGYPNDDVLSILAHLTDTVMSMGNLNDVVTYFPDHIQPQLIPSEKWLVAPAMSEMSKSYTRKYKYPQPTKQKIEQHCVFLIDATSISFMESILDMVKHYQLGTIVGTNSSGCNGDAMFLNMSFAPFTMTGYKFMNRDGSQHHGIGIKPDIYVENIDPFIDKQLDAAIKFLKEK